MKQTYTLVSINNAINLLRPNAKYVLSGLNFIQWNDPRPIPSYDEICETIKKIQDFEESQIGI